MDGKDPAGRNFGETTPYHIRVFHEHKGRYWINPSGDRDERLSLEDYMKTEARQGYVLQSLTGAVEHPERLRIVTKRDAKEAETLVKKMNSTGAVTPIRVCIFEETGHEYLCAAPEMKGITLDQFLADHQGMGYALKGAVGMLEQPQGETPAENKKLRVILQVTASPKTGAKDPMNSPQRRRYR